MVCRWLFKRQGQARRAAERRAPDLGGQGEEGLLQEPETGGKARCRGDQGLAAAASQPDKGPPCSPLRCGDPEKVGSPEERFWRPFAAALPSSEHGPHQVTSHHIKSISRCFYQISVSQAPRSLDLDLGTCKEHYKFLQLQANVSISSCHGNTLF